MGRKRFHPVPVVATDTVIPLHSLDGNHINASILLYFLLRFDDVLDTEKLRDALQKLLNRDGWRKLGARLRINVGQPRKPIRSDMRDLKRRIVIANTGPWCRVDV